MFATGRLPDGFHLIAPRISCRGDKQGDRLHDPHSMQQVTVGVSSTIMDGLEIAPDRPCGWCYGVDVVLMRVTASVHHFGKRLFTFSVAFRCRMVAASACTLDCFDVNTPSASFVA
jgi:hypothetical protein